MSKDLKKHTWILPAIWMVVIFLFSHQPGNGSAALSGGVTGLIMKVLDSVNLKVDEFKLHTVVRAGAHFVIFFVLGGLWYISLRAKNFGKTKAGLWAICICFIYAIFDEGHQYFVPGRVCDIKDIVIDTFGAGAGILTTRLLLIFRMRTLA